jgi:hypothetical protein
MGAGFLLVGGFGYGLIMASRAALDTAPHLFPWLWGSGLGAVNLGIAFLALSTWRIFRPDARGRAVLAALVLGMFGGHLGHGLSPGFEQLGLHGPWAWLGYSGRILAMGWGSWESFHYAAQVRRQQRLGLGDAEVGRRCFWWGVGGACAMGIFVRNGIAQALGHDDPAAAGAAIPTIALGLGSSWAILRAFFWKERRAAEPSTGA